MSIIAIMAFARKALAFFASPVGLIIAAAAFIGGVYLAGDHNGAARRDLHWRTAQLQAEIDAAHRDTDIGELAADDDDSALAEILKNSTTNRERLDAFKTELAKRSGDACRLSAGDVAGLRLDGPDPEICGHAAAGAKSVAARSGAFVGRECKAVLADYRGALREANARICAGDAWYRGVKKRYGSAPLK